ncbi:hypothetical protein PPERSA_01501 [Pseudocohnilembus persalinus]|uniref:Uncharacterized protein n=1 Tax=Pseudocohnilembus persalinus TaxID=266149 RepID=A0A0V0QHE5_PSEPJ|nr:hypothetical protein PPERSA_01501 [Pseudocohnilembus persalinus]|eukprot:KRX01598.1 hypothetical protein PPERSA_01501 [Pseudocohnilembus persalinus]
MINSKRRGKKFQIAFPTVDQIDQEQDEKISKDLDQNPQQDENQKNLQKKVSDVLQNKQNICQDQITQNNIQKEENGKQLKQNISTSYIITQQELEDNPVVIELKEEGHNTEVKITKPQEKDLQWEFEDLGPFQKNDENLWVDFKKFIQQFFNNNNQKQMWISSVINTNNQQQKKAQIKPPKNIDRAIPGGRYGCAQLVRCCGPLQLQKLSLGKLNYFAQEAINKGILIFYKTLLIYNEKQNEEISKIDNQQEKFQEQSLKKEDEVENQKLIKSKIEKSKIIIKEILNEEQNKDQGVKLTFLPKKINQKTDFEFNIQDLGFYKLTQLLYSINGLWIENEGTIQATAFYNQNLEKNQETIDQFKQIIHDIFKQELQKNQIKSDENKDQKNDVFKNQNDYEKLNQEQQNDFNYLEQEYVTFDGNKLYENLVNKIQLILDKEQIFVKDIIYKEKLGKNNQEVINIDFKKIGAKNLCDFLQKHCSNFLSLRFFVGIDNQNNFEAILNAKQQELDTDDCQLQQQENQTKSYKKTQNQTQKSSDLDDQQLEENDKRTDLHQ